MEPSDGAVVEVVVGAARRSPTRARTRPGRSGPGPVAPRPGTRRGRRSASKVRLCVARAACRAWASRSVGDELSPAAAAWSTSIRPAAVVVVLAAGSAPSIGSPCSSVWKRSEMARFEGFAESGALTRGDDDALQRVPAALLLLRRTPVACRAGSCRTAGSACCRTGRSIRCGRPASGIPTPAGRSTIWLFAWSGPSTSVLLPDDPSLFFDTISNCWSSP